MKCRGTALRGRVRTLIDISPVGQGSEPSCGGVHLDSALTEMNQEQNHLPASGNLAQAQASRKATKLLPAIQKAVFTAALASIGHVGLLIEAVNASSEPAVGSAAMLAPTLEDRPKTIVDEVWQIVNRD